MTVEFKGGVNGKTIIDCEGGVNGNNAFEYEGGVNGKTIAGCDGGVNGNDIVEGADVVETDFECIFLVDWGVAIDFLVSSFLLLFNLFFLNSSRFKGGLKLLILPPNLSWPDCFSPPKPPPKQS